MVGIVHALTLALVVLLAAPLATHIPLSVLAGVLLFVAWNMGEWREFARLKHFSGHYRLMLLSTFIVTIVFDLTVAVELGLVLAVVLFVRRQSDIFRIDGVARTERQITFRLYGPLFSVLWPRWMRWWPQWKPPPRAPMCCSTWKCWSRSIPLVWMPGAAAQGRGKTRRPPQRGQPAGSTTLADGTLRLCRPFACTGPEPSCVTLALRVRGHTANSKVSTRIGT